MGEIYTLHMTSTRNKNTPQDYAQEQIAYQKRRDHQAYETASFFGMPENQCFVGAGLVGMKAPAQNLSSNSADIESLLFGVGSTNLVSPLPNIVPNLYSMPSLNLIDRPVPVYLPLPLEQQPDQRPMILK